MTKIIYRSILLLSLSLWLGSCSEEKVDSFFKDLIQAPASSIERDVKGHEQIYAIHAILRVAIKGPMIGVGPDGSEQVQAYSSYHIVGDATNLPLMQEIDIAKDDEGQMRVVSERDHFDVIASDQLYYALELKYYDQNGMLINHQFSGYPFKKTSDGYSIPDEDNATLLVHQHFFSIGNSSLGQSLDAAGKVLDRKASYLAYPRTLDEPVCYYDRYTFKSKGSEPELASKFSTTNVFAPRGLRLGTNQVPYSNELVWRSIEVSGKPEYAAAYTASDGKSYQLYKAIDGQSLAQIAPELFTYEYRDTDPVEEELGKTFVDSYADDFIDPDTDAPRQRYGETVGFLRQSRSLDPGTPRDRLGFKGLLQFHKANMAFQLQVRICHIQNKAQQHAGETEKPAKYGNVNNSEQGYLWDFNQIQPGWDSFDIDYPLPVRVIADSKEGQDKCYELVKRYYPQVDKAKLWELISTPNSYLSRYRHNVVLM